MFLRGYRHFLTTAASLQWDEAAVDLAADARAWPQLTAQSRAGVRRLIAGFCVGEDLVASELQPFADVSAGGDRALAACFRAQAVDEARHARLFDRVAEEVMRVPGADAGQRRQLLRAELEPAFLDLFEEELPRMSAALARGASSLAGAVTMYHLLLEGIVFTAGQFALLDLLDGLPELPGLRRGTGLVLRDERWHIGLGATLVDRTVAVNRDALLARGQMALGAWGDAISPAARERVLALHRRRLNALRPRPTKVMA